MNKQTFKEWFFATGYKSHGIYLLIFLALDVIATVAFDTLWTDGDMGASLGHRIAVIVGYVALYGGTIGITRDMLSSFKKREG